MKIALLWVVCCAFARLAWAGEPFAFGKTGIVMPDAMAGFARSEIRNYDFEGKPANSMAYGTKGTEVTVYLRSLDPAKEGTPVAAVENALGAVKEMEERGMYSNVKIVEGPRQSTMPGWATMSLTFVSEGVPLRSFIFAAIKGETLVKVRYTTLDPKDDAGKAFMAEMEKIVGAESSK